MMKNKKTRRIGTVVSIVGIVIFTLILSLVIIGSFIISEIDTGVDGIVEMARNNNSSSRLYTVDENGEYKECTGQSLGDGTNREYAKLEKIPKNK